LDGVRAVAAFLVVFYHFGIPGIPGGLGVLIFFVLSGFLITWLLLKESDRFGTVSLRDFYMRRCLRIFPAFYCYWLLTTLLLLVFHKRVIWGQAIASLLYVSNYYQVFRGDPNTAYSHTWSLGIEEQFYLLWPVAFVGLRDDYNRMARCLVVIILAVWAYRAIMLFGFHAEQGYFYAAFETRADHLAIGCLLAVALRAGLYSRLWNVVCASPWISLALVGVLSGTNLAESLLGSRYRDGVNSFLNPILVAALLVQAIAFRQHAAWSWLNAGWIRYLGRISYSIYLYQQIAVSPVSKALGAFPAVVRLTGTVTAVVLLASASYYFVERPFLKLKDRFKVAAR
jgi:peptidoglycan/LPS O-acetylase OafA/YrhL